MNELLQKTNCTWVMMLTDFFLVQQKREKAQEDLYVREHEKEKLNALRKSIQEQKEHLTKIEEQMYVYC